MLLPLLAGKLNHNPHHPQFHRYPKTLQRKIFSLGILEKKRRVFHQLPLEKWLWPEAGEVYFIYFLSGCPWLLGDVPFASRNIQALPEHSVFLLAPGSPWPCSRLAAEQAAVFGMPGIQSESQETAGTAHPSPPLSRNKAAPEQLAPHLCAAQSSQRRFSRKQKAAEWLGPGFPGGSVGTKHSTLTGELM